MPDREERTPQTVSPAHREAGQAKAEGLPDPTAIPVGWRQRSFRNSFSQSSSGITLATRLAAGSRSECQIQNSTRNLHLLVVLDSNIQRRPLKRDANVRIGPLANCPLPAFVPLAAC